MTKQIANIFDSNGVLRGAIYGEDAVKKASSAYPMYTIIEGQYSEDVYLKDGQVKTLPPAPLHLAEFDTITETWVDQRTTQAKELDIRNLRKTLLENSDWTDTLSAQSRLGTNLYNQWQSYRQALRDITIQEGFPENITWPTPPQ